MAWWTENRLRLIQHNLRETDANLDVDRLIERLQQLSANTLMLNAGGIVAFYPTQLEFHYRAAEQRKDLLREATEKAHAAGLRFIARFDFSKAHETIFAKKPGWFYRTRDGREVNYHGIVHTCINGEYQREYSLLQIDEVISNYDVDGIFFNMFGYQTRDYSGIDYGICYCDACRSRFRERSGLALPERQHPDDPAYAAYRTFQRETTREMLDRIHALVQRNGKDIAISTYNEHKVDIVRKESNTDPVRPHPVWLYSASENVKSLEDSWDDKLVSNCCINAIDLIHRFTAVSPHEINIRLKEGLASGSGLDFCIIGVFEDYPDLENVPVVAEAFAYHRQHERYYGRFQSMADVALIKPGGPAPTGMTEYRGLFKMLKERHILFDVLHQDTLAESGARLGAYKAVLVPDIVCFTPQQLAALSAAYDGGTRIVGTGRAFTAEDGGISRAFVREVFDAELGESHDYAREAAYFQTADKGLFKSFPARDWVMLKGPFAPLRLGAQAAAQLPFVLPSTFGPPERASGHRLSDDLFGAALRIDGEGRAAALLPWQVGELYYRFGYADHRELLLDVLEHLVERGWRATTNASQAVELFANRLDERTYIVHLLNLSGFNGVTYFEPVPMYGIEVTLHGVGEGQRLETLTVGTEAELAPGDAPGDVTLRLKALQDFAALVVRVQ